MTCSQERNLIALQREEAVLPHRHGGMCPRLFSENVVMAARHLCVALACAAMDAGSRKGDPFRGSAALDARSIVKVIQQCWPSVKSRRKFC